MAVAADPNRQQAVASDPKGSAWVSANAGSGKTHVLVNRVVRLLLNGTAPERILCLTYTKAAAAEMSDRLFDELAGWIALDDQELMERIWTHTGHSTFKDTDHARARRLFTRALETPGGLKIQTIHAFCERLLQRFPVEAGVVPGFEVLDDEAALELRQEARARVLRAARGGDDAAAAAHLATLAGYASDDQFDGLIRQVIDKRRVIMPLVDKPERLQWAVERLHAVLGTKAGETVSRLIRATVTEIDRTSYEEAARYLSQSSTRDKDQAERIERMLACRDSNQTLLILNEIFINSKGAGKSDDHVITKNRRKENPLTGEFLLAERDRVVSAAERIKALRVHEATCALLHLGADILTVYEAEKRRSGLYDYDDLILKTLGLLEESGAGLWVLYKLDGGLDHILIDEAQDTSPEQWQIIQRLTEEFFSGEGARSDVERTIFAVGDRKQSIYSFQGADPAEFDRMRRHFWTQAQYAGQELSEVPLQVSFRSTPEVLDVVDKVFAQPQAADGLVAFNSQPDPHQAVRAKQAGLVELWELEAPEDKDKTDPWRAPDGERRAEHPRLKLAARIADTIKGWVANKEMLTARGRAVRYGDILILVRNRTTFTDAMVRALKLRGIPVAGADRLKLVRHIAVQDLLSLARFVLLASDDLSLAEVLKSPLVARDDGAPIDDDDLFRLAHGRGRMTLWRNLHVAVSKGAPYANALKALRGWQARAGFETPYDFFTRILTGDGRRKMLLQRLGSEAGEPLDAFVSEALNFEHRHSPDLMGFVRWLEGADLEIKRDMDHSGDEVRVMTVHGAKGLEANIVFLPDTTHTPDRNKVPALLFDDGDAAAQVPVWRLRKEYEGSATRRLNDAFVQRMQQEENRLLYVAMTRARDRLYVCGHSNKAGKVAESCWYQLVANVLKQDTYAMADAEGMPARWRIAGDHSSIGEDKPQDDGDRIVAESPPDWLVAQPVPEGARVRPLVASRLATPGADGAVDEEAIASPLQPENQDRFKRGNLIHRLLQLLPELDAGERRAAARRYLAQPGHELAPAQIEAVAGEVLAVMDNPDFAEVFATGSRAEVAVTARLQTADGPAVLSGQIDRLAVSGDEVVIVDYKTNRPPPQSIEEADPAYIHQLAAYRAALMAIYPGRAVRAGLLWTNTAVFMEVPEEMMEQAVPAASAIT